LPTLFFVAPQAREFQAIVNQYCFADDNTTENDDDDSSLSVSSSSCRLLSVDLRILTVDLPELQQVDTLAIAKNKAVLAAQLANGPCLVEDTSLCFHALGGMPGPYIKWFQDTLQSEGTKSCLLLETHAVSSCPSLSSSSLTNRFQQTPFSNLHSITLPKGLYKILAAYEDKTATAICTLAFSPAPHADVILFTGRCEGTIVPPQPGRGFGWDGIFVPHHQTSQDNDRPFSQLSLEEKNAVSHRGQAVRQWADWFVMNQDRLRERQKTTGILGHQGLKFATIRRPQQRPPQPPNESTKMDEATFRQSEADLPPTVVVDDVVTPPPRPPPL
jgi:inosine triphosphate pyrophosphatase